MSDLINRQDAIDALCAVCGNDCDKSEFVYNVPQDEQVILCPEHYCLCTLPSAETEQHLCRNCKWVKYYGNVDKNGNVESYWRCMNWDDGTDEEGYCHEWESR